MPSVLPARPTLVEKATYVAPWIKQQIGAPLPEAPNQLQEMWIGVRNELGSMEKAAQALWNTHAGEFESLYKTLDRAETLDGIRKALQDIRNPNDPLRVTRGGQIKGREPWYKRLVMPQVYKEQKKRACAMFGENATAKTALSSVKEELLSVRYDLSVQDASLAVPLAALDQNRHYVEELNRFANDIDAKYLEAAGRKVVAPKERCNWPLSTDRGHRDRFARAPE